MTLIINHGDGSGSAWVVYFLQSIKRSLIARLNSWFSL